MKSNSSRELSSDTCLICNAPPVPDDKDQRYMSLHGNKVFLCGSHASAFHAGVLVGQLDTARYRERMKVEKEHRNHLEGMMEPSEEKGLAVIEKGCGLGESNPRSLFDFLGQYVVGQEEAKRKVCLAVFEHYRLIRQARSTFNDSQNILLLGPSGSGKTLLMHAVSEALHLPFTAVDATSYSPTGFQGADADSMVSDLMHRAEGHIEEAEKGLLFIDEIDKLSTMNVAGTRAEAFNYSTQSSLLKLIEGKRVKVSMQPFGEPQGTYVMVDTSRMLFSFGGAFTGLAEIVGKHMGYAGRTIGLRKDAEKEALEEALETYEILRKADTDVLVQSLIDYGMSAELVGRIPTIVPLAPLTLEELRTCLMDLKNSPLPRQRALFAESGYYLDFDEDFIEALLEKAKAMATGARALRSLIKHATSQAAFELLDTGALKQRGLLRITRDCLFSPGAYVLEPLKSEHEDSLETATAH